MSESIPVTFTENTERNEVHSLPESRLYELISAIGNHEGKALLLLSLAHQPENSYFSQIELHNLLQNLPGADDVYLGKDTNKMGWCKNSLEPIGMVAKADYGPILRFGISEEGKELGVPLAALLLDFSHRHKISLFDLFGATVSTGGKRSPEVRIKIIEELLTSPNGANLEDLVQATGVTDQVTIGKQLRKMSVAGLLNYDDWDESKSIVTFSLIDEDYKPKRSSLWRKLVIECLESTESPDRSEIINYIRTNAPQDELEGKSDSDLSKVTSSTIFSLEKHGIIKSSENRKRYNGIVRVSLSEDQARMWSELLNSLHLFTSQEPKLIEDLNLRAKKILIDQEFIKNALNSAAEASPYAQNGSQKSVAGLILRTFVETGDNQPQSVRDIVEGIKEVTGRTLSHNGVQRVLKGLIEKGRVVEKKEKTLVYSLVGEEKDSTSRD